MTKEKISEYDPSADGNTDVNGVNIAEGCAPSGINNAIREVMAALKRFETGSDGDSITVGGNLVVSGGTTANTIAATVVNASGNATVGGTLVVTGATTFSGNVVISGTTTAGSTTATTFSATVVQSDTISEKTSAAGVTVDGVLLKDSQVSTNQINEKTSASGVTVDGVLLKDTTVTANTIKASGTSSSQGEVQLFEDTDNGTNYVALKAPASIASNLTLTLPSSDGTSGQSLVTNGSGVLSFATPSAGAYVFLSTSDFSSTATADFTLPSGYDAYQFVWGNVIPATDNVDLYLRTSTDGGANYDLTAYDGVRLSADTSGNFVVNDITTLSGAALAADVGSAAGEEGISGIFTIFYPQLAKNTYFTWHFGSHEASGRQEIIIGSGIRDTAADVDAVRFLFSAGNIESGTITLYGMKNS